MSTVNQDAAAAAHQSEVKVELINETTSTPSEEGHDGQSQTRQDADTDQNPNKNLSNRARKRLKRLMKQKNAPAKKKKKNDELQSEESFQERSNETSFYFENGLRKIYPYTYTFSTWAKERWYGRKLFDVFRAEFQHHPEHVLRTRVERGLFKVNGEPIGMDYVLKNGDYIEHPAHRHEVPVTDEPIEIVHECDEMFVINKPASIPCHPCGNFRHNSAIFILEHVFNKRNLRFVHRLDRLTSGLLIMAKSEEKAAELSRQVSKRQLQKEYVCRVEGEFPSGIVECNEPLQVMSHILGLQYVTSSGKEARTTFERMSYNGKSSVVKCLPHTGRTHQIRVHLQYLGHPIINDPLYNTDCWGELKGKGGQFGASIEEVCKRVIARHDKMKYVVTDVDLERLVESREDSNCVPGDNEGDTSTKTSELRPEDSSTTHSSTDNHTSSTLRPPDVTPPNTTTQPQCDSACDTESATKMESNQSQNSDSETRPVFDRSKMTFDPDCADCIRRFKDPKPEQLRIYLHALRYKGPDWEYCTPLPYWADHHWQHT